jgi:hypothetical protein
MRADRSRRSTRTSTATSRRWQRRTSRLPRCRPSTPRGHGMPLGATLIKMIDEYALHAGQTHMLRFAALGELIR